MSYDINKYEDSFIDSAETMRRFTEAFERLLPKRHKLKYPISRRGYGHTRLLRNQRTFNAYFRRHTEMRRCMSDAKLSATYGHFYFVRIPDEACTEFIKTLNN